MSKSLGQIHGPGPPKIGHKNWNSINIMGLPILQKNNLSCLYHQNEPEKGAKSISTIILS